METFDNFCHVTGVDNEVKKDAAKLWLSIDKAIKAEDKPEESQLHWIVCSIYIVVCNKRCLQENPVTKQRYPTVSELLKAGNLRLVEFFLKMKTILKLDLASNKVEEPIKRMEKKFLVAAALFSKLKRLWASIVTEETNDIERAEKFTQCWLLFIVIKAQQPDASCDLMIAFHILLCCINHVTDPSDTSTLTQEKSDSLQRVSSCFGIPFSKIEDVYAKYWLPFFKPITKGVSLQSRYQELYERQGDFDERLFLEEDNLLQALPASTNEDDDNGQGEFPNDTLRRFWNSCRTNPTQFVLQLLKASEKVFTAAILGVIGEDHVETTKKLCIQGRKIFFRVMESMLLAEEKRLNCSDFSALLNSKAFNKTLLVCSLEVSLVSSDVTAPELSFPWILSVFDIKPYDFFKVIESFVLHEPHLSSNIRKHLNSIEELIIESLAWKTGSPLIESLKRYNPATSDTTSSRSGQNSTQKCQPLNLFLRKVNQMAYMRLTALCSQLELSQEQVLNTWTCLEQSIRFKWQLFQDRHVDQMILCAIYSISRVLESDIQFKQIVQMYKKLPHSNTQVYKNVRISDDEQDTIIGFYNRVYMPAMKDIILQFTVKKQNPPASPVPQHRSPSRPVPGKKNIYVSPLKKTPRDTLSPATKSLYSFGDLPGSADRASLSRINESMRAENLRTTNLARSAVMKKLRFEDKDISSCSASKDSQQEPSELSRENHERSRAVAEILAPVQISSDGSFTSGSTSFFNNTNSNIIVKDNDNALDC